ncbi:hypothetical protein DPMN_175349 [Dreissena polymorpha]|uniref:Secreted protein n=1 Tax=Dreissena polymorpha TaxID=45954 RepID=A0A9D4E506_DREPO|nr:hypothetical protein DPMN_175349 [Dreissena polymorpha]
MKYINSAGGTLHLVLILSQARNTSHAIPSARPRPEQGKIQEIPGQSNQGLMQSPKSPTETQFICISCMQTNGRWK